MFELFSLPNLMGKVMTESLCNANANVFPQAKLLKFGCPTGLLNVGLDVKLHIFMFSKLESSFLY